MERSSFAEGARPTDLRLAVRLCIFVFLCHLAQAAAKVFQIAVFLPAYGREAIPAAFLASSIAVPLASSAFAGLVRVVNRRRLVTGALLSLAALMLGWRLGLARLPHGAFVAYVLADVVALLAVVLAWNVVNASLDPRQAKRLVPLVGLGSSLAFLAGGFGLRWLARAGVDARDFTWVAAASAGAAAVAYWSSRWELKPRRSVGSGGAGFWGGLGSAFVRLWRVPLLRVLLVATVLVVAAHQVLDFAFLSQVQTHFRGRELPEFLGLFVGILGIGQMLFQSVLSSRILFYLGGGPTAAVAPGVAALGGALFFLWPHVWIVVAVRFVFRLVKTALYSPAVQSLYSPLDREDKTQAMALLKGIVSPVVAALGALALLVAGRHVGDRWLGGVLAAISSLGAVWLAWQAKRAYVEALNEAVDRNGLRLEQVGDEPFDLALDRAAVQRCLEVVRDEREPQRALFALELLAFAPAGVQRQVFSAAMESPHPTVRMRVLELLRESKAAVRSQLVGRGLADADGQVVAEALRCLEGEESSEGIGEAIAGFLADPRPVVRAAAALRLLAVGRVSDARRVLEELMRSPRRGDRLDLAWAVSKNPTSEAADLVAGLLEDEDVDVQRMALHAAAALGDRSLVMSVARALGRPKTRLEAVRAAVAIGEPFVRLAQELVDEKEAPEVFCRSLPAVLAGIASPAAMALLERLLDHPDDIVVERAARRLWRASTHPALREDELLARVVAAAKRAHRYRGIRRGLMRLGRRAPLLDAELGQLEDRAVARAAALAALSMPGALAERFWYSLESASASLRASAVELLDSVAPRRISGIVVPLLEVGGRYSGGAQVGFEEERRAANDPAQAIALERDRYLRLFFAYELADLAAGVVPEASKEVESMASVVEKMLFLKGVSLFETLSGEELHRVADIAQEYHVPGGRTIFNRGDPGDAMYLVLAGQVRIVLDGKTVAVLGRGECFGEMALLDKQPRSADAVAHTDVDLLRIEGADFDELLEQKTDIARGILKVLTERLRTATAMARAREAEPEGTGRDG